MATQAIYQGVFSSILALVFYSQAVSLLGPGKGAIFGAIVPGVSLLMAIGILGEPATLLQYAGVVVIFSGVIVTLELIKPARKQQKALLHHAGFSAHGFVKVTCSSCPTIEKPGSTPLMLLPRKHSGFSSVKAEHLNNV
ncbi:DMT family transporter [Aestuariicella hydrocarbonica]|uniref:DMT family transporter n=1 Tax=Pseudomaricurvus hydrocarbonicus TaxID=1470433 RepID=A0A9E5MIY1_9GAMM|nr:DMT family transporter [Aestuariicella hydrocarbonica]